MKILFVHQSLQSFVKKDLNILQEKHDVCELRFASGNKLLLSLLPDLCKLVYGIIWCDIVFCWFGKLHALFAVLFSKMMGKRSVVVAGGDDVACVPDCHYGMFTSIWKKWCPLFVFRFADLILSVSEYNYQETIENTKAKPEKVRILYHGFDLSHWKKDKSIKKENMVISIGRITTETKEKKGLKLFVQSAAYLPDLKFILIGPANDGAIAELKNVASPNVEFINGLYDRDLIDICNRAKVYVQPSYHESFGCSVAEAMLCECIPVVSAKAAIPEVVGDVGLYIDELKPQNIALQIKNAFNLPPNAGERARQRIIDLFPLRQREEKLLNFMKEFFNE